MRDGGGGSGHGPSPRDPPAKRRPVGSTWRLRAHTRETASPFSWGGGGPCRNWSRRSALPPIPCPWEGIRLRVGRGCPPPGRVPDRRGPAGTMGMCLGGVLPGDRISSSSLVVGFDVLAIWHF